MDDNKGEEASDISTEKNKTYIISTETSKCVEKSDTVSSRGRFALQRRKTNSKGAVSGDHAPLENTENQSENPGKRLTLQRRTRAEKSTSCTRATAAKRAWTISKILSEPNRQASSGSSLLRSASVRETEFKSTDTKKSINRPSKTTEKGGCFAQNILATVKGDAADDQGKTSTPTGKTKFEKVSLKKEVFERWAMKDISKPVSGKHAGMERHQQKQLSAGNGKAVPAGPANKKVPIINQSRNGVHTPRPTQTRRPTSHLSSTPGGALNTTKARMHVGGETPASSEVGSQASVLQPQELKMENSAVTVAVRVRPFSSREKDEREHQVIFMDNQETIVKHPETKQTYTFSFDMSFYSVEETDTHFAGQQMIYEKLANPLLERAFEGFNTCLFAYGQTGSGKSYTMMGFGEEPGVIPRFCEELFMKVSEFDNNKVTCHLEMSYFEVYNEKIHDLLVVKDEQNQKKIPLRVREHPVDGPYVEDLSTNVVSSYADIQTWFKLGNKQRATAATGMNDKSSRSHSVFTLVMTQTKTELVEEEQHDHRIISRINLVDLAGSER